MTPLLMLDNVTVSYGAIHAVRNASLHINTGELVCLIGANGAGKSTLLNCIAGVLSPRTGRIQLDGQDITRTPAATMVTRGLALVPEGRGIFAEMSVQENLLMGAYTRRDKPNIQHDMEHVYTLFPRLAERQHQSAGTLSGGEQQLLALARALLSKPRLLLLDEPSMGLAPLLVQKIMDVIRTINQNGVSVLLVEQNASAALALANRGYVMEHGDITLSGAANTLIHDPAVKAAYLGM